MATGRILVVDADEAMRELLHLHLSSAGYEVALAEDAIEAGYALLKSAPDLIVCAVALPHMSGFELVAALRADPTVPEVPVIFLTSVVDGQARARDLGADYLLKPIDRDALLAAISRRLRRG